MFRALFRGRRLWLTPLVLIGVAILVRLGFWQLDRLAQRRAINAALAARMAEPPVPLTPAIAGAADQEYRHVEARGVFDSSKEIVQRNRALDGAPGVHVLTPLRLAGSDAAILVDRGWLPQAESAPEARQRYAAPTGEVVVVGQLRHSQDNSSPPYDPPFSADRPQLDAWFHVDVGRIQQQAGYPLLPAYIEQLPAPGDLALPRRDPLTDLGEGPHLSYAIQWFAFALILLVGYLVMTYRTLKT
jgi:surfeit locus 1 family protein